MTASKVVALTPNLAIAPGNELIAQSLEALAERIRDGEFESVANVLCVVESRTIDILTFVYGDRLDKARAIGLLTMAMLAIGDGQCTD